MLRNMKRRPYKKTFNKKIKKLLKKNHRKKFKVGSSD